MADEKSTKVINTTPPLYLHPVSNTNIVVSSIVLHGDNYEEWDRSLCNAFKENKFEFNDGLIKPLTIAKSDEQAHWVQVNSTYSSRTHNTLKTYIRSLVP
ncbi:Ead protein [Bienertia sinuspersici]